VLQTCSGLHIFGALQEMSHFFSANTNCDAKMIIPTNSESYRNRNVCQIWFLFGTIWFRPPNSGAAQHDSLDHVDVGLHVHHVPVPPVVLEAKHQGVRPQPAQTSSLWGGGRLSEWKPHNATTQKASASLFTVLWFVLLSQRCSFATLTQ